MLCMIKDIAVLHYYARIKLYELHNSYTNSCEYLSISNSSTSKRKLFKGKHVVKNYTKSPGLRKKVQE